MLLEDIMKRFSITLFILMLFLMGCSAENLRIDSFHVEKGMDEKQVISIMGMPDSKYVSGNSEVWEYKKVDMTGFCYRLFFVWFTDGVVKGVSTMKPINCGQIPVNISVPGIK
jgi:hypothetical protein